MIETIPKAPGSYLLWMRLDRPYQVRVGRLGLVRFAPGHYFYAGSARGPGGLYARLNRHLNGGGRIHWHVDYLRQAARIAGYGYLEEGTESRPAKRLECTWSQALAAQPEAAIPVAGFGSSDCSSGCLSHLVFFPSHTLDADHRSLPVSSGLAGFPAEAAGSAPERPGLFEVKWGEFG